jgi:hypothetical protein
MDRYVRGHHLLLKASLSLVSFVSVARPGFRLKLPARPSLACAAGMPARVLVAGCDWREVKNRVEGAIAAGKTGVPTEAGARI